MKTNPEKPNKHTTAKTIFEIPAEGALGLLALGAVGVKAWKEKRGPLPLGAGTETNPPENPEKENPNEQE